MTLPQEILERIRSEYLEMPGMRLTPRQLQRLCGIGPALCDAVLESMVDSRFLTAKPDGTYARATEGLPQSRMAKVSRHEIRRAVAS